ncbi:MAG: hypothetical protein GY861_10410 [bacterium]|nr:hypothetical protein [bacterium]
MFGNEVEQSIVVEQDELGTPVLFTNVNDDGFYLSLDYPEKESRLFYWKEVVQMLIDMEPDMLGNLDDPDESICIGALEYLGFQIPPWRMQEIIGGNTDH